jgi:HD-like signal output (HDOD) protein
MIDTRPNIEKISDHDQLRQELQRIDLVRSPPMILQEILAVVEDPRAGAKEVQVIVERDMSCSVKLLKLANSAYYGFSRQVKTIREAIVIIGLDGVKNVAMSLSVAESFVKGTPQERDFLKNLWIHSMATATAASVLCRRFPKFPSSMAYCAGLVHDFGKVILQQHFGATYALVVEAAKEEFLDMATAERNLLGVDHATVGGWIGESWDLPDTVTRVLNGHHSSGPWEKGDVLALVVAADAAAYESGIGHGGSYRQRGVDDPYFLSVDLDETLVNSAVSEIKKQGDRFEAFLQVDK